MTESEATVTSEINDDEQQLIRLCLKKPLRYNWELTTSKSSSSIAFPTIQLYDEKKKTLLAEANEAGFVASSRLRKSASVSKASSLRSNSRSSNGFKIKITKDSIEEVDFEPIITEPDDDFRCMRSESPAPLETQSERGLLVRDAKRTKPYARSSSNSMRSRSSVSILERISELKRSSSSEESGDDENEEDSSVNKHKYSIRRCTLGTIIVPKQSFSNVRRRRPKPSEENSGEQLIDWDFIFSINESLSLFINSLIIASESICRIKLHFTHSLADSSAQHFISLFFVQHSVK